MADATEPGDGSGDFPGVEDYLNPDADTLFGKVSWGAMISGLVRGWIVGVFSVLTGAILAVRKAYGDFLDDVRETGSNVLSTITSFPQEVQAAAVDVAAGEVAEFGVFAGPVSAAVLLVGLAIIAFIAVVIIAGGDG